MAGVTLSMPIGFGTDYLRRVHVLTESGHTLHQDVETETRASGGSHESCRALGSLLTTMAASGQRCKKRRS